MITIKPTVLPILTHAAEQKFNAKYVCDFDILTANGWANTPVQIYYNENPPNGFYEYFALFTDGNVNVKITSAKYLDGLVFSGLKHGDEIIFSGWRHDYVCTKDRVCFIDGGRDYTRYGGEDFELIELEFYQGQVRVRNG